jgi:hypothetical protein
MSGFMASSRYFDVEIDRLGDRVKIIEDNPEE